MTNFRTLTFFILTMGLFPLVGCGDEVSINTGKRVNELDTISFENLSKKSHDYMCKQQEICLQVYKIGSYQRWYYDQATGKLTFSDNGLVKLIIDYEEVGSVSLETDTWLWAWDNPYLEDNVKEKIAAVRNYGRKRNFTKLITAKWAADETDGWEMAAIANYLLQAKGVYRVPVNDGKLLSYMFFKKISWADTAHSN